MWSFSAICNGYKIDWKVCNGLNILSIAQSPLPLPPKSKKMLYIKALHIIFVVTWFAGLFYIVRLFVYYAETVDKSEPKKSILQREYLGMQSRLWYGITWPSAVMTAIFGPLMLMWFPLSTWLIIKLLLVVGLYFYHFSCQMIFNQQQKGIIKYTGMQLRVWNEVATLFLISIVFLVVLKNTLDMFWAIGGLVLVMILIFGGIQVYKKIRKTR
jgi:protoporphyrinogen IX oxidase